MCAFFRENLHMWQCSIPQAYHTWMIFNLGTLFLLQLVHWNNKLEQESRSTFLLFPL